MRGGTRKPCCDEELRVRHTGGKDCVHCSPWCNLVSCGDLWAATGEVWGVGSLVEATGYEETTMLGRTISFGERLGHKEEWEWSIHSASAIANTLAIVAWGKIGNDTCAL